MLVVAIFWLLMALTATNARQFAAIGAKTKEDWILDLTGLFVQGLLIPLLQFTLVLQLYHFALPALQDRFAFSAGTIFLLGFVFVDYLYYWNHRLLHSRWLWNLHKVHHTMTDRDVLGTSRNTVWTSFLIIYLWIHPFFIYCLAEPSWYILAISFTSALDLWRHSAIEPTPGSFFYRLLSPWLILPKDHAWHHAASTTIGNYGANFKLWDKLHGTYYPSRHLPNHLGIQTKLSFVQKLTFPFNCKKLFQLIKSP